MSGTWWEESNGNGGHTTARIPAKRQVSQEGSFSAGGGQRESRSNSRRPSGAFAADIFSDSEVPKQRRASMKANNRSASRKRSKPALKEKKSQARVDDDAWIHRDKLAAIEIQEMEEAGIHVRSSRRSLSAGPGASARSSRSQSRSRRPMSKDVSEQYVPDESYPGWEDFARKRVSTIPAADEEDYEFDPRTDTEFRTPEEILAERQTQTQHVRPSTSRLPLAKSPSVPVRQDVVDRDSPLPRSRAGSGAYSGNWDDMQYARRARSTSMGSQVLLDDGVTTPPPPGSSNLLYSNDENSPPKSRVPGNIPPNSGARKMANGTSRPTSSSNALNNNTTNRNNTTSRAVSGAQRPSSRSGHKSRPSTSHAPEGEAPWIASMYKPDPRLPPDQQILPTHAKRMQQDAWEREGKSGTAYDRDFRPLNDEQFPAQRHYDTNHSNGQTRHQLPSPAGSGFGTNHNGPNKSSSPSPASPYSPASANLNAWPLTPQSETLRSDGGQSRPGTSGGYKITPTITSPRSPGPPSPNPQTQTQTNGQGQGMGGVQRVPEVNEKEDAGSGKGKKGKGCGCCVVM